MTSSAPIDALGKAGSWLWLRFRSARLPNVQKSGAGLTSRRTLLAIGAIALAAIVTIWACKTFLPEGLPNGIILLGLITGGLNALPALGIVLIYRANRLVNFAQGELGAFAASLAFMLIVTSGWSWFVAVPVSLLAAALVGALTEFGIMRRFFTSPRLLATVATIGVAQLLGGLRLGLPGFFGDVPSFAGTFPSPFADKAFELSLVIYSWNHALVLIVVPLALVGISLFLRGTWAGLGTRAAAENVERSRLLGVPVRRLSTIVWALAGLLSGLTAILRAPVEGFSLATYSGTSLLTRSLAPAAIGGFQSLGLTFAASLLLGVVEQAFFWNFATGGPIQALLLVVLIVALLIRSLRTSAFASDEQSSWVAVKEVRKIPAKLARMPQVRVAAAVSAGLLVLFLLAAPSFLDPARVTLLGLIGIHAMVGLSLVILSGWAGQVSLGQWAIVGLGAFIAGNLATRWGLDFFLILAIGAVAGGLVSLILGIPAQRMPGLLYGVTTLVFGAAMTAWVFQMEAIQPPARPARPVLWGVFDLASTNAFYYLILAATALVLGLVWNVKRFRLGDVLVATRDNPRAAEAFGISITGARRIAFFLSGSIAGFAGVVYAFHQQIVDANRFPAELGLSMLAMVVIGGLGSISGTLLGAVYVRTTQYLLPSWAGFLASGLGLLIIMLVFPGGLGEMFFRIRARLLARFARSKGIPLDRRDMVVDETPPLAADPGTPVTT